MRGVYKATIRCASISAAKTLFYLTAPSNVPVDILDYDVTCYDSATNQQLECTWQRITSLGTPTGTSITATKSESGDQAAASTVVGNVTASEPTYGSSGIDEFGHEGWGSAAGWGVSPIPEARQTIKPGDTWGIRLISAPSPALSFAVRVSFQEKG